MTPERLAELHYYADPEIYAYGEGVPVEHFQELLNEVVRLTAALQEIEDLSGGGYDFNESGALLAWQIAKASRENGMSASCAHQ